MKPEEALKIMSLLVAAYPNANVGEATMELYCRYLLELPYGYAQSVVSEWVAAERFFPTIAELIDRVRKAADCDREHCRGCDRDCPGCEWYAPRPEQVAGAVRRGPRALGEVRRRALEGKTR